VTHAERHRIQEIATFLIKHAHQLDYPRNDVRGERDAETWRLTWEEAKDLLERGGRLQFDCSQSSTQIFRWAKVGDPNGLDYKHAGYTGTMLAHLRDHYTDPRRADVGALVVFGPGTGEHVAVVIARDHRHGDPALFSHGAQYTAGPIRLSVERLYHHRPVTFLSVAGL